MDIRTRMLKTLTQRRLQIALFFLIGVFQWSVLSSSLALTIVLAYYYFAVYAKAEQPEVRFDGGKMQVFSFVAIDRIKALSVAYLAGLALQYFSETQFVTHAVKCATRRYC